MDNGKEKGYVLYDEVSEFLTEDYSGGRQLDDLLTELDGAGVEILEEPKLEFDKKRPGSRAQSIVPIPAGDSRHSRIGRTDSVRS